MRANPDEVIPTEADARKVVEQWKGYMPFRNWCAIELPDGWQVYDSIRSAKTAWKKAKPVVPVRLLSYGKD